MGINKEGIRMKAILMSIKPQHVANILNKIKTLEIRKRFPSDYVGWVYIYCTKGNKKERLIADLQPDKVYHPLTELLHRGSYSIVEEDLIWNDCKKNILNGKVIARFWCDKVETFRCNVIGNLKDGFFKATPYCKEIGDGTARYNCDDEFESALKNAQLTNKELAQYLGDKEYPYGGHYIFNAIHITKLEIFDKPKEIREFMHIKLSLYFNEDSSGGWKEELEPLTRAPQSWQYIEVDL